MLDMLIYCLCQNSFRSCVISYRTVIIDYMTTGAEDAVAGSEAEKQRKSELIRNITFDKLLPRAHSVCIVLLFSKS